MVETVIDTKPATQEVELALCPICSEYTEEVLPITAGHHLDADDDSPNSVESVVCKSCADLELDLETTDDHFVPVNQIGEADYSHVILSREAHMDLYETASVEITFKVMAGILILSLYFLVIPSTFSVGADEWAGFVVILVLIFLILDKWSTQRRQKKI